MCPYFNFVKLLCWATIFSLSVVPVPAASNESQFRIQQSEAFISIFEAFSSRYWKDNGWHGASSWTSDLIDRTLIRYLRVLQDSPNLNSTRTSDFIDNTYVKIINRAIGRKGLFQYFTQANDDFGWIIAKVLDVLEFSYEYQLRYPQSTLSSVLPLLRSRLAFRASFFHDIVDDSWTVEFCGGGVEWLQRTIRRTVWPVLDARTIYKNTITNKLYVSNCAQIYNACPDVGQPLEFIEIVISSIRSGWKRVRPVFGWNNDKHDFSFQDVSLLDRASEGLDWMQNVDLLTDDSLFTDGYNLVAEQGTNRMVPANIACTSRNDAIFTYNQLASLRALKRLFEAKGNCSMLEVGYDTISALMSATQTGPLGSGGVLEETCDQAASCNQDQQAFKGATFIDLIDFCSQIQRSNTTEEILDRHRIMCQSYRDFVDINALAAYSTMDSKGRFGGAWDPNSTDTNSRGRGRTIETQQSALAALIASLVFAASSPAKMHAA